MANQVDEEADLEAALKSKRAKGTHDGRLQTGAEHVSKSHAEVKKNAAQSSAKRQTLYSREALLPKEIVKQLPFKNTRKALTKEDKDSLRELLCSFTATIAEKTYQYGWPEKAEDQKHVV